METEQKNYRQPWFKFYSQDWLTDLKIRRLSIEDKLCYIILLCLANSSKERGKVLGVTEDDIIHYAGFYNDPYDDDNEVARAKGCLGRFHSNGSVVTTRNEDGTFDVEIKNFMTRQGQSLTNSERQAKFRERAKNKDNLEGYESNDSDVTEVTYREDKSRVEKRRIDKREVQVANAPTPQKVSEDFFNSGQIYQELLTEFSEGRDQSLIEKEFQKFILYWTEPNKSGTKVRWQQQNTFEVRRRLYTWLSKASLFSQKSKIGLI